MRSNLLKNPKMTKHILFSSTNVDPGSKQKISQIEMFAYAF
jgi:hypothetical protein